MYERKLPVKRFYRFDPNTYIPRTTPAVGQRPRPCSPINTSVFRMSRRQLKKLSGYDETAELAKAMGLADEEIPSVASKKSQPRKPKKGGFASFLDLDDEVEDEEESEEVLEEKIEVKQTPKKKKNKKKNKKKQNTEAKPKTEESFEEILDAYGFKHSGPAPTEVSHGP